MIKRNFLPISVSLVASMICHIIILSWVSGYQSFSFPDISPGKALFINLREFVSPVTKPSGGMKTSDMKTPPEDVKTNNNSLQTGRENTVLQDVAAVTPAENSPSPATDEPANNVNIPSETASGNVKAPADNHENKESEPLPKVNNTIPVGSLPSSKYAREKLSFAIYWLGIYAGEAVLEAAYDNGTLRITSQVHSSPVISAFYKVEDYAESLTVDGMPAHTRIKTQEGTHRSDKETVFDMVNKKVTFLNNMKGTKKEHAIESSVWDILSAFYYFRTLPFEIGKPIYINIFDSNKFLKTAVNILRKEKMEISGLGEIGTVMVKPEIQSEGLFQKRGDIFIWLTDDEKRIPVRVETKVPVGNIVAELREFEIR